MARLYDRILRNKIKVIGGKIGEQAGFTARRSCVDWYTLQQIIEKKESEEQRSTSSIYWP